MRSDVITPLVGASGAKGQSKNDKTNVTTHGPAYCQCRLNPAGCLFCRRWDKKFRAREARETLRRHLMQAGV